MPPIFLIVGAPATGKSTASRALAAKYPKSIAICVDDLRAMVVSGMVNPSQSWGSALTEQLQLARKCVTEMAKRYHAAGFAVVIDDFYDPYTQLSEYSDLFGMDEVRRAGGICWIQQRTPSRTQSPVCRRWFPETPAHRSPALNN
jgi:predicted kinase